MGELGRVALETARLIEGRTAGGLNMTVQPEKKSESTSDSELLNLLMERAVRGRCACIVCHTLREEYVKRLKAKAEK